MHKFEYELLINHRYEMFYIKEANKIKESFSPEENFLYDTLIYPYFAFDNFNSFEDLINIIISNNDIPEDEIIILTQNTILEKKVSEFLTIYRYAKSEQYSTKEKIKILNTLFNNKNFTIEEINLYLEKEFFLKEIIFETIYNYYHSDEYNDFLKNFI